MFSHLGPIDFDCDAPPYAVVAACAGLGFQSPLDVRWCRLTPFLKNLCEPGGVLGSHAWKWLFGSNQPPEPTCTCGQLLPLMGLYTFTFASKKECHYLLGQCCRCRTMFWEEVAVPSRTEPESGSWGP